MACPAPKAYVCTEDYEGIGGIIFAKSNIEARKAASSIWGDGELRGWSVNRAPGLDKYEQTGVPAKILIDDGWRFECHGCGMQLDVDNLRYEGMTVDRVVGKESGQIFCSHVCRAEQKAEGAEVQAYGEAFLDMMKDWLLDRFPRSDISFGEYRSHFYIRHHRPLVLEQAEVSFSYPSMTLGPAALRYEKNGNRNIDEISCGNWFYTVPSGDVQAYEAWAQNFPKKGYI